MHSLRTDWIMGANRLHEATLAPTRDQRRDCRPQDSKSTEPAAALSPNGMILPTAPGKREAGKLAWRLTRSEAKVEGFWWR
jgi:hypothetical protein